MGDVLEIISVLGASMIKFALSQIMSYQLGFSFTETLVLTAVGGCLGVLVFYRTSAWFMERARLRRVRRMAEGKDRPRWFTRTNRTIVRVKRAQGIAGLAFLTPVLISIPIGTIIAAKYFRHDRRTLPIMLGAVVAWAVVLSSLWRFTA